VVPEGVSTIHVVAQGAPGSSGGGDLEGQDPFNGGGGAVVSGDLTGLTPGQTLYVEVGQAALPGNGNGGSASDVRTVSRPVSGNQAASLASRASVADHNI
jgi:hypothetical protein